MVEEKQRQITPVGVKDELATPLAKLTLLLDLMNNNAKEIEFTNWGKDGLYTILDEAVTAIEAVHDAEITIKEVQET